MRDRIVAFASVLLAISVDAYEVNIPVEHSFDGETFIGAGQLQGGLFELGASRGEKLTLQRKDLAAEEQDALARLVKQNGMYKLRIQADPSDASSPKLLTSIPARCLASAGFKDNLQLHATPSGRFVGINYDYAQAPCNPAQEVALPNELNFEESASVPVWLPVEAPVLRKREPILGEDLKDMKGKSKTKPRPGAAQAGVADEKEPPPEDNRPWIVKNWMIALPIAFIAVNALGTLGGFGETQQAPAAAAAPRRGR